MTDLVTVVPPPGLLRETAQALLALARDPADVATIRGGTEFVVPSYLAEAYTKPAAPSEDKPRRARRKKEVEPDGD